MNPTRTGKIARAPYLVRARVNEMLRDGADSEEIIAYLDSQEIRNVNTQNLTNWRQGGHQDWLKEQERHALLDRQRDFALEIVKRGEGQMLGEAAQVLAASQLFETLSEFDLQFLKDLLRDSPSEYPRVVNSLTKISRVNLDVKKFKFNAAQAALLAADTIRQVKNDAALDNDEKIQRVREALFGKEMVT